MRILPKFHVSNFMHQNSCIKKMDYAYRLMIPLIFCMNLVARQRQFLIVNGVVCTHNQSQLPIAAAWPMRRPS